jgi:hypothetical protein
MYEHRSDRLLPKPAYIRRVARNGGLGLVLALGALLVGVLGYRFFEGFSWLDALVNASMILGGMGPVNELHTDGGKIFASAYALFSGAGFLVIVAVVMAPVFHRFLHRFHLEAGRPPSAGAPHPTAGGKGRDLPGTQK